MENYKNTPENAQPTSTEVLKKYVDHLFNNQEAIDAGKVKRYIGADEKHTMTVTRDPESQDYKIEYGGVEGPSGAFSESYGVHEIARLTHDGKLIDLSERTKEDAHPDYDYEKIFAPVILDTLEYSTNKPRRILGRMAFAVLNRNK